MQYREALAWLYATQISGIKLGLANITRLLDAVGFPTERVDAPVIIHVAGTNGKGSVCAMADSICRAAGWRTALFTSPHLVTYRERIRLDGEMIPEAAVADGLTFLREVTADWEQKPTFFEYSTALALRWFQQQGAEVIVLETGLGGRFDSTNAIFPAATAITPISMDHQQYLGPTLASIAGEKAGIFKPGTPALSAPQTPEAAEVLTHRAEELRIPLTWVNSELPYPVALAGAHQRGNAALAVAALQASGLSPSENAIKEGLATVSWPGRFQRIDRPAGGTLVLDGAHNEASAEVLAETWRAIYGEVTPVLILGSLSDKDLDGLLVHLLPLAGEVITTAVANPRTRDPVALADEVRTRSGCQVTAVGSAMEALRVAEERGTVILATGSLFLLGDLLQGLQGQDAEFASAQ